jgi:hypothetical protein
VARAAGWTAHAREQQHRPPDPAEFVLYRAKPPTSVIRKSGTGSERSCSTKRIERDDDLKKIHHASAGAALLAITPELLRIAPRLPNHDGPFR